MRKLYVSQSVSLSILYSDTIVQIFLGKNWRATAEVSQFFDHLRKNPLWIVKTHLEFVPSYFLSRREKNIQSYLKNFILI